MALDYSKAGGVKTLLHASTNNNEKLNSIKVVDLPLDEIDENPDNGKIFNMEKIQALASAIEEEGFSGAIEVFKKPDGRYEISAGHRRYKAMKFLNRKTIPAIVSPGVNDIAKAKKLLSSNINNRVLSPLDMANAVNYYMENVLKPSNFKGNKREECMRFFSISKTQVHRYLAILKMIPELQEMSSNPIFPYTAFTSASTLTEEQQRTLYNDIIQYRTDNPDIEISRVRIEQMISAIRLKDEHLQKKQEKLIEEQKQESVKEPSSEDNISFFETNDKVVVPIEEDIYTGLVQEKYLDDYLELIYNQLQGVIDMKYSIKEQSRVEKIVSDIETLIKEI